MPLRALCLAAVLATAPPAQVLIDDAATGAWTSTALVDGVPAIAYLDVGNVDVRYVRATDAEGTTWGTPVTVASTGDVGTTTSLAVVGGRPAIAYWNRTDGTLDYVRADDATGAAWGTPVAIASGLTNVPYASLAVVDGRPAVAYVNMTTKKLEFLRASDATGATWPTTPVPVVLQIHPTSSTSVDRFVEMTVVDGRPAIVYSTDVPEFTRRSDAHAGGNPVAQRYVRASDAQGSAWGSPTLYVRSAIDSENALAVVDGRPAILYVDADNTLSFLRADDASGSAWPADPVHLGRVDAGRRRFLNLTVANGVPVASADMGTSNSGSGRLFDPGMAFVVSRTSAGEAWNEPETVTTDDAAYQDVVVLASGAPLMSYYAVGPQDLYAYTGTKPVGTGAGPEAGVVALTAFPNPTTGPVRLRLAAPFGARLRVTVHDALGRQVAAAEHVGAGEVRIETAGLAAGAYLVRAVGEAGVAVTRVVVSR